MIVLMLQGGLSNQIFQYAAARHLAIRRQTKLVIDTTWYNRADQSDGVDKRVYELAPLNIQAEVNRPSIFNKILLKAHGSRVYFDETQPYVFHPEVLDLPNYSRLFGFFQNERYFKDIADTIHKEVQLKSAPTGQNKQYLDTIRADENSVSVHIRRGDYVTSPTHSAHHGAKTPEYYLEAAKLIKKTVPKPSFYVFSDDPAWCKQNLKFGPNTLYVDHNSYGGEDMRLMQACRHNIIANSSFSWWGAWLNQNPNKVVVAPKKWLNDPKMDTSDILPKSWLTI